MLTFKKVSPLGLLIISIVVVEVLIFVPKTIKDIAPGGFETPSDDVDLSIKGFRAVSLNAQGQKETIDAKEAELYQDEGYAILKGVRAKIFSQGDDVLFITGTTGKYYLQKKDMEFYGDIVAVSENLGYQLKTSYLKYDESKKQLSTDEKIWVAGPNPQKPSLELTGRGLLADTQENKFSVLHNVYCKKYDEGAESIEIDSDSAEVYMKKNEALFKDNVIVTQKNMNIFSDNFLMTYNRKDKAIKKAVAYDGVKIVQGDRTATCKKAYFLNTQAKIVLTGSPKVVQQGDVVEAKVAVFYTSENKITFDEAVGEVRGMKDFKGLH